MLEELTLVNIRNLRVKRVYMYKAIANPDLDEIPCFSMNSVIFSEKDS